MYIEKYHKRPKAKKIDKLDVQTTTITVRPMLIPGEARLAAAPKIEPEPVDNGRYEGTNGVCKKEIHIRVKYIQFWYWNSR